MVPGRKICSHGFARQVASVTDMRFHLFLRKCAYKTVKTKYWCLKNTQENLLGLAHCMQLPYSNFCIFLQNCNPFLKAIFNLRLKMPMSYRIAKIVRIMAFKIGGTLTLAKVNY